MSWLRRLFSSRSNTAPSSTTTVTGPVFRISSELPSAEIEGVMNDLTSMLGVSRVIALNRDGKLLFDYTRWAEEESPISVEHTVDIVNYINVFMEDTIQTSLNNAILRSEGANILIQIAEKAVLFTYALENINLALISIRVRRAAISLSRILGGKDTL